VNACDHEQGDITRVPFGAHAFVRVELTEKPCRALPSIQFDSRLLWMYHSCQVSVTLGQGKLLLRDLVLGMGDKWVGRPTR
jgi:hypothetical protein